MDTYAPTLALAYGHGHGHGGGFGGLLGTFVHSIVASLGWQAGRSIASFLGSWLIVAAVLALGWYLIRHRRGSRRR